MQQDRINDTLQSRRDSFKKVAIGKLSMLGTFVFESMAFISRYSSSRKMKYILIIALSITIFSSCDTFLQGMGSGMYGNGGYGMGGALMFPGYMPPPPPPTAQQILNAAAQQVENQNQKEYQAAKRYRKDLTYEQFLTEKANAYEVIHNSNYEASSSSTTSSSSESISSSRSSHNSYQQDCRLCYGRGHCRTCEGKGFYYSPYDLSKKIACPNCPNHNGKCSSCGGTGKK